MKQAGNIDDNDHLILLEQYKLYVEMADKISARRADTNRFYISLLTALLVALSIIIEKNILASIQNVLFLVDAILGIGLCLVWIINIESYAKLNASKFQVIHDMELLLPFSPFHSEWELLGKGEDKKRYLMATQVEQLIPFVMCLPYIFLLAYSINKIIQ